MIEDHPGTGNDSSGTTIAAPRSVGREITIQAPVGAVWNALTSAEELVRWFPLEAQVESGVGGRIRMRWNDAGHDDARIEIWEPERQLRVVDDGGSWVGVATDYHLRPQGGAGGPTVLRVVSSGFGASEDWSDLLEAFGLGWDFELRGLQHYLERHPGERRIVAAARAAYTSAHHETWARIVGPGGFFGDAGVAHLAPGEPFAAVTASGDRLTGTIATQQPPRQLVATVRELNDALLRVQLYARTATVWLSTYGVPADQVRALETRWTRALALVVGARA